MSKLSKQDIINLTLCGKLLGILYGLSRCSDEKTIYDFIYYLKKVYRDLPNNGIKQNFDSSIIYHYKNFNNFYNMLKNLLDKKAIKKINEQTQILHNGIERDLYGECYSSNLIPFIKNKKIGIIAIKKDNNRLLKMYLNSY